jgi:hypothetical protein
LLKEGLFPAIQNLKACLTSLFSPSKTSKWKQYA